MILHKIILVGLVVFVLVGIASLSLAQQPTARISALNGSVLVSGSPGKVGTILQVGDTLETQSGTEVVLELSDGSMLELGENTSIDMAVLSQQSDGARVSRIKLLWGRLRATISPGHQQKGASFDIETPNALVGVKFSLPRVGVSYDSEQKITIALAYSTDLFATNFSSGKTMLVPMGSTARIIGMTIEILPGIEAIDGMPGSKTEIADAAAPGFSRGTVIAVGAGSLALAGGVVVAVNNSGSDNTNNQPSPTTNCSHLAGVWRGTYQEIYCDGFPDAGTWDGTITNDCSMTAQSDAGIWFNGTITGNTLNATGTDSSCGTLTINGTIQGDNFMSGTYTYSLGGNGTFDGSKQ